MKSKLTKVMLTIAAAVMGVGLSSSLALAAITGSTHDFSSAAWNQSGQICIVCHTPHNGQADQAAPLWNHTVTTASFTLYKGVGTLNAVVGAPSGISKACLSCHDGTVALDSFGGNVGATKMTGNKMLGTDLNNDHPVSFTYDTSLATADGGLKDPSTATGVVGTIKDSMLFDDKVECATCHDVHNGTTGTGHLLVKGNDGSKLCLTCHAK